MHATEANPAQLGRTMRDSITGFSGIAITFTQFENGNAQFGLQPPMKDGADKPPEPFAFDYHNLEIVASGPAINTVPPRPEYLEQRLGVPVEHKISGFKGTAHRRSVFVNGCVYYTVLGKWNNTTGKMDELFAEHSTLVFDPVSPPAQEQRGPGGPSYGVPTR